MPTFTHRLPGLVLTGHEFILPLDYTNPTGAQISVFARAVVAPDKVTADLPWLVFFQGGPGSGAPRPPGSSSWLPRALQEYRVLLLDQRGTGLSTPVTTQTLARLPTPQAQADYLKHFRADNIVRDAEAIRQQLVGPETPWSGLGQSYGGFCLVHYLSAAPHGLREAIITGGLPPLRGGADVVYRATYPRVLEQNRRYYARYPQDVARVQALVQHLGEHDVRLPSLDGQGARLTPRRLQQLGLALGTSDGFEEIHYLLEEAFVPGRHGPELDYRFLHHLAAAQNFETNPIFAILHEAIYCQGEASNWSAARIRAEYPQFEICPDQPVMFTGEMIYPWMFDDYAHLRPLQAAAEILAADASWPSLYDPAVLRANQVPCAAAVYYDDMYVECNLSLATAQQIGGIKLWITNEYQHNGLRADGERVLGRLLGMLHGTVA